MRWISGMLNCFGQSLSAQKSVSVQWTNCARAKKSAREKCGLNQFPNRDRNIWNAFFECYKFDIDTNTQINFDWSLDLFIGHFGAHIVCFVHSTYHTTFIKFKSPVLHALAGDSYRETIKPHQFAIFHRYPSLFRYDW